MLTLTVLLVTFVTLQSATHVLAASPECMFGPNCLLPCRCQTGPCDSQTGFCLSTDSCSDYPPLRPWSGPGCQIGNLAYSRQQVQDNNPPSDSTGGTMPVDGDLNTCFLIDTEDAWENPFWIVDLEEMYVIQSVDIYQKLLDGYDIDTFTAKLSVSLMTTNSSDQNSALCGSYEGPLLTNTPVTVTCDSRDPARYIKIRRLAVGSDVDPTPEKFDLCEVVVVGHIDVNVTCDKCLQQNVNFCGNGIWCEECQAGYESPDCRETDEPTSVIMTSLSTVTSSTSTMTSSSTIMPSTSTMTSSSTVTPTPESNSDSASPTNLAGSTTQGDDGNNMRSVSAPVTQTTTPRSSPKDDTSSDSNTSVQLIIFTVVGIFIVILVTLAILGICVCIRRHRVKKAYADTPNSTLTRRTRRNIEKGYPQVGFNPNEDFADNLSRHSSILDIEVMETIHEEKEKDSSKHSSCSSLHSSNVKAEGSASLNGSVKRYSNRSL